MYYITSDKQLTIGGLSGNSLFIVIKKNISHGLSFILVFLISLTNILKV